MDYPNVHEERVGLESVAHDPFIDGLTPTSEQPAVIAVARRDGWAPAPACSRAVRRALRITSRIRGH